MRKLIALTLAVATLAPNALADSKSDQTVSYGIAKIAEVAFGTEPINFSFQLSDFTVGEQESKPKYAADTLSVMTNMKSTVSFNVYDSTDTALSLYDVPGLASLLMDFGTDSMIAPFSVGANTLSVSAGTSMTMPFQWVAVANLKAPQVDAKSFIVRATIVGQ
ncbi:hypothetical protein [Deinococcus maricopensis]|uniref:Uncharacterized protein n=1 Tax=Deinococcus maricopensis (strain DSM 21211 / LMG 22137 / NRRL B-23946 / LB-34) TaxID=709986 RepID=E8U9T0_DEIML|nr:hypothetical protein [Deinococcus maricopensis]ADV67819.1 hypothetical protein Deima_2179 [Deinococcus maricopensis DSM 21211]